MSSHLEAVRGQRICRLLVGLLVVLLVVVGIWVFRTELKELAVRGWGWIREAGPAPYFAAMSLVPLPLAWFTVPAGELFAAQLTVAGVIAAAMAAVVGQLSLSYAVARYALRPAVERLVQRRGYTVPRVTRDNAVSVVLLVRLLPGPPMILGSCTLAVAEVPFAIYLGLSSLVALPWVCAGVILGHGLLNGHFALAATGVGLMVALVIAVRLISRRWKTRAARDSDGA
jgi:uncharacterized membrane protein YdjX (TVP38/TMEM64 family)